MPEHDGDDMIRELQETARRRRNRSILLTLALLLPALLLAYALTKVSTDAVSERDMRIATLSDSLENVKPAVIRDTITLLPDAPGVDTTLVNLLRELQNENTRLRDSLATPEEPPTGNNDDEAAALKKRLDALGKKLAEATAELNETQTENKALCEHITNLAASVQKLQPLVGQNQKALFQLRQMAGEFKKAGTLCR